MVGVPVVTLLDAAHDAVPVCGSGGFTSDTTEQALALAWQLAEYDVRWLEEPVTSDDLEGLRLLRDRGPGAMDIAAGEYGYDLPTFRDMLHAGAVDCLQADVSRCGGITGFLRVGALCDAHTIDLSAHCAPAVSAHACSGQWHLRHLEYFHDHVRIEHMLFDGVPALADGCLVPHRDAGAPERPPDHTSSRNVVAPRPQLPRETGVAVSAARSGSGHGLGRHAAPSAMPFGRYALGLLGSQFAKSAHAGVAPTRCSSTWATTPLVPWPAETSLSTSAAATP